MISVGIDVSKGKSMVCIMKPGGEVLKTPFEMQHTMEEVLSLVTLIKSYDEEVRVILESTGYYHLPIVTVLLEKGIFISTVNALRMQKFCSQNIRRGIDAAPYQSGSFNATERHISKRGKRYLRMTGFEVMQSLIQHKPADEPVFAFIEKKRSEGKCGKEAMIAGLNKFLRIYYGKVTELYNSIDEQLNLNTDHIL